MILLEVIPADPAESFGIPFRIRDFVFPQARRTRFEHRSLSSLHVVDSGTFD